MGTGIEAGAAADGLAEPDATGPDAADRVAAPVDADALVAAEAPVEAPVDAETGPAAGSGAAGDADAGGAAAPVSGAGKGACVAAGTATGAGARPGRGRSVNTIASDRAIPPSAKARRHFSFFLQAFDCEAKASIRSLVYVPSYRVAVPPGSNQ